MTNEHWTHESPWRRADVRGSFLTVGNSPTVCSDSQRWWVVLLTSGPEGIRAGTPDRYIWYNRRKIQDPEGLITGYTKRSKFTLLDLSQEIDKQYAFGD